MTDKLLKLIVEKLPKEQGIVNEQKYIDSLSSLSASVKNECIKQNLGEIRLLNKKRETCNSVRSECITALKKLKLGLDKNKIMAIIMRDPDESWEDITTALTINAESLIILEEK